MTSYNRSYYNRSSFNRPLYTTSGAIQLGAAILAALHTESYNGRMLYSGVSSVTGTSTVSPVVYVIREVDGEIYSSTTLLSDSHVHRLVSTTIGGLHTETVAAYVLGNTTAYLNATTELTPVPHTILLVGGVLHGDTILDGTAVRIVRVIGTAESTTTISSIPSVIRYTSVELDTLTTLHYDGAVIRSTSGEIIADSDLVSSIIALINTSGSVSAQSSFTAVPNRILIVSSSLPSTTLLDGTLHVTRSVGAVAATSFETSSIASVIRSVHSTLDSNTNIIGIPILIRSVEGDVIATATITGYFDGTLWYEIVVGNSFITLHIDANSIITDVVVKNSEID